MKHRARRLSAGLALLLIGGLTSPASAQQPEKVLGVDAALAMIIGGVLLIIVVIGIVAAMSRRRDGDRDSRSEGES